jgi:hypothetical protein
MGGAVLNARKTGRDFRADGEKIAVCFHKEGWHTSFRPPSIVVARVGKSL